MLQQTRDEYYTSESLKTLFETIPEVCIIALVPERSRILLSDMKVHIFNTTHHWNHSNEIRLILIATP